MKYSLFPLDLAGNLQIQNSSKDEFKEFDYFFPIDPVTHIFLYKQEHQRQLDEERLQTAELERAKTTQSIVPPPSPAHNALTPAESVAGSVAGSVDGVPVSPVPSKHVDEKSLEESSETIGSSQLGASHDTTSEHITESKEADTKVQEEKVFKEVSEAKTGGEKDQLQ